MIVLIFLGAKPPIRPSTKHHSSFNTALLHYIPLHLIFIFSDSFVFFFSFHGDTSDNHGPGDCSCNRSTRLAAARAESPRRRGALEMGSSAVAKSVVWNVGR